MKIALITIWHENNYGAELQAYATVKALQQLGHQVKMIYILLSDCHKPNFKGRIAEFISSFGPGYKKFDNFWKTNIPVTRRYHTIEELQSNPPKADVYMVGSDQVWNPELTGIFAKLFFLDFGNEKVKKISYSSSFGTPEWNYEKLTEEVRLLLLQFDRIASREQSGVQILKDTFGVEASLTVDPTLLFEQYQELTGPLSQKKTLVYYPLSDDYELEKYAIKTSQRLGLQLVNNKKTTTILGRVIWDKVGIEEWVRNIAESQFVITRSFHGLVFSLLYGKNFAIMANRNNRGTRLMNLLEQVGLEERYYDSFNACDEAQPWNKPIDYDAIYLRLSEMRSQSYRYIMESLK